MKHQRDADKNLKKSTLQTRVAKMNELTKVTIVKTISSSTFHMSCLIQSNLPRKLYSLSIPFNQRLHDIQNACNVYYSNHSPSSTPQYLAFYQDTTTLTEIHSLHC